MEKLYRNLPDSPGVYLMKDAAGNVLYVGKAGNLRRRVSSYFQKAHDYRIERLVGQIAKIDYQKTDTAIEALILEAELIKKLAPPYNVREKDDKSFLYVEFTKENFPRVLLVRGKSKPGGTRYGPFTSAGAIREALRILRRIFPYSTHSSRDANIRMRANDTNNTNKRPCFEYEIGLCPGTCVGAISKRDYAKNIRNLKLFFEGKKARILKNLEREMAHASKTLEFEKAAKLRGQIFALKHIQDVALISETEIRMSDIGHQKSDIRIEGYDISNISGTSAVGSMVVFANGKSDTNEYRKFKIRTITQSDDTGMLKEVLRRRFKNSWTLPNLILIDGGKGQVNAAKQVLNEAGLKIPVIGIAKGPERKRNDVIGFTPKWADKKTLIRVRDEAHRFAIQYHKKLRNARSLT